jgi:teichuronic acid biosynthesis glycosyltransferase TuaC
MDMTTSIRPIEFVQYDERADMLVVTNMWPEPSRPVYGVFVERQVEFLRQAGLRIDVLYVRGYISKIVYLRAALLFLWLSTSRQRRYRLVHVHGGEMALVARVFLMKPMVATYHGDDVLGYKSDDGPISRGSRLRSLIIRHHAALFNATVTQSKEMHDRFPPHVQRHNRVIHCGVDAEHFSPMDRNEARRQLGWDDAERIVLFAATKPYEPRKRIDLAEAAVKHAEGDLGPIRFVIAENLPLDSIPIMMNAADCLLVTSMNEGGPLVVKEALLCNLPVVATDVGDVRKVLDGVSPSAICGHDARELGAALTDVLKANRRTTGRDQRAEDFDQSTTVAQLLNLYADLGCRVEQLTPFDLNPAPSYPGARESRGQASDSQPSLIPQVPPT